MDVIIIVFINNTSLTDLALQREMKFFLELFFSEIFNLILKIVEQKRYLAFTVRYFEESI